MKRRRASIKGAMFNYLFLTTCTTYKPKFYLHKYSMGNIKSLKINFIRLNYKEFNQTPINQQQIKNLLISTFKIWVMVVSKCYKWLFRIVKVNFRKITDEINLFKNYNQYLFYFLKLL
jgi:hypothetical protein